MESLKAPLLDGLKRALAPAGVLLRNDSAMRELEGLADVAEEIGTVPDVVRLDEGGVFFDVALKTGQKTGWFFDQRDNRDRLARYARGARVLDVFSYVGAWGLRALRQGAAAATCVDSSAAALAALARNAQANGLEVEAVQGQALEQMQTLAAAGRRFEIVIVDPPALIKKKKDAEAGESHYARLNRTALSLLAPDGILVSCSCSFHLEAEQLQRLLLREARAAQRRLQILETGGQGPDHPVHPAIPETRYLKAFFCRVA
jgi:23S rRNA (cytosine1962-C5)-methyltransferase